MVIYGHHTTLWYTLDTSNLQFFLNNFRLSYILKNSLIINNIVP